MIDGLLLLLLRLAAETAAVLHPACCTEEPSSKTYMKAYHSRSFGREAHVNHD